MDVISAIASYLAANWNLIINEGIVSIVIAVISYAISYIRKKATKGTILRAAIGTVIIFVGIFVLVIGVQVWDAAFQVSKATSPSFIWSSLIGAGESVVLDIIGILLIIEGGLIINREKAMKVIQALYEHFKRTGMYDQRE